MQQIRREENFESILQFFFTLYSTVLLTLYTNIKKEKGVRGERERWISLIQVKENISISEFRDDRLVWSR